jgi:hypothetical protein
MSPYRTLVVTLSLGAAAMTASLVACETPDPTMALVENAYPVPSDPGDSAAQVVVYKAWWATTLFNEPVVPGAASDQERSVPESDFVYALLAPGWDPGSGSRPTKLIAVKSKQKIAATRGDTLHIVVSDGTFAGSCDAVQVLSQEDADFITQRIFPGDFADTTYDAKTCTSTPVAQQDAGARD